VIRIENPKSQIADLPELEMIPFSLFEDYVYRPRRAALKIVERLEIASNKLTESMSTLTKTLIEQIKSAPETVQREVFHFLVFLKARHAAEAEGRDNLLPLAQTDWNAPEEDDAWRNF